MLLCRAKIQKIEAHATLIVRIVVVIVTVVVHIVEVRTVTSIRRTQPPVSGATKHCRI